MQKPLAAHPVSATFFDKIDDSIRIKIQQKDAYKCWMAASNKDLVKYSNKMFEKGNSDHEEKFFKMMEKNVQDNRKTAEKRANKRKAKEPQERQYNEDKVKNLPTFKRWELLSPGESLIYKQKKFKKGEENAENELIERMIKNNMSSQKQYMTSKAKKSKTMSNDNDNHNYNQNHNHNDDSVMKFTPPLTAPGVNHSTSMKGDGNDNVARLGKGDCVKIIYEVQDMFGDLQKEW